MKVSVLLDPYRDCSLEDLEAMLDDAQTEYDDLEAEIDELEEDLPREDDPNYADASRVENH